MVARLFFLLITCFWLVMSYLLVRSEFGARDEVATAVPAGRVWEKVITAPDDSSLEVFYQGKKIGYCRWSANVGDELARGKVISDEYRPEGMVKKPADYTLDLDANLMVKSVTNNLRVNLTVKLSPDHVWKEFGLRATMRPNAWELHSVAAEKTVRLVIDDASGHWEQKFTYAELQNPEPLVREMGGPLAWNLLSGFIRPAQNTNDSPFSFGLHWEAHNDWMKFGHSKVRVYRMQANILDRYKFFVFVSRVGEILWVELPGQFVLSNDAFSHF